MKIVIAPDSFKECLPAYAVGESIKKGFLTQMPEADIEVFPMADGGEGTLESLIYATKGKKVEMETSDPLGNHITTHYGILGDNKTVVIEMAQVAGLQIVTDKNINKASTFGVGELIKDAIDKGHRKFIIGLGGSATNDGGAGMLHALGGKFFDAEGEQVPVGGGYVKQIATVDLSEIHPLIYDCEIIIASDVENELCGPHGATYVFGPQKGAKEEELAELDKGIHHYANLIENASGKKLQKIPGAGAAGGLGFGLLVLGAEIRSGARIVAEAMNLEKCLQTADWVITGEGKSDSQSLYGKVPVYVASIAKKYRAKTILLSGALGKDYQQLYDYFTSCHSITRGPISLVDSMKNAEKLLYDSAYNIARLISLSPKNDINKGRL
ncbi:glycerate kinase [Thalassobacillus devorans]|uniref:Glycerate kinase n=1 Tax=Thalassobacillus devorans TaxID=279813 RepID=A0ABQ1P2R2_9BACI|nr:glycerate kinase [Thalassobacillus devorans]NIK28009.1 glycerate kinase [Thalassobacillus devorans]GGC89629.1 glycerate kinase [Thalassobacillus devorans]